MLSGHKRIWRQHTSRENALEIDIWIGFITIKSVTTVTFVSILPKDNFAWDPHPRHNDGGIPIRRRSTAAYTPAGNPGALGLHTPVARLSYRSPSPIVCLRGVHSSKDRTGAMGSA